MVQQRSTVFFPILPIFNKTAIVFFSVLENDAERNIWKKKNLSFIFMYLRQI